MDAFDDEIEDPADSFNDAMAQGARYMLLAQNAFAASDDADLGHATALDLARANYLQLRALSFYQFAAVIKDI